LRDTGFFVRFFQWYWIWFRVFSAGWRLISYQSTSDTKVEQVQFLYKSNTSLFPGIGISHTDRKDAKKTVVVLRSNSCSCNAHLWML